MLKLTRLFLLILIGIMNWSFTHLTEPVVEQGNVIYAFESGKMQCQSEINPEGYITVLLKSLTPNTTLKLMGAPSKTKDSEFLIKILMEVSEKTDFCASWKNVQEVEIVIDPLPTQSISLQGKKVYKSDQITVMIF